MFRQRTSSQKPADDLLANFRQQFPEVAASPTNGHAQLPVSNDAEATHAAVASTLAGQERTQIIHHNNVFPDQDPTPRASTNEPWKFTPSLLDPGAFSFSTSFPNSVGYYAQTPGGNNSSLYHHQAGDLHTPTLGGLSMGLNTPMTLATSDALHGAGPGPTSMMDLGMSSFHTDGLHPQAFQAYPSFAQPPPQQAPFAPSTFVHPDGTYGSLDQNNAMNGVHTGVVGVAPGFGTHPGGVLAFPPGHVPHPQIFNGAGAVAANIAMMTLPSQAEKFRFHTTLNAPTAMVKHADEIPISYLNKGQAYSISIIDMEPELPILPGTRFRTFVRISFEDEQQRQKPGVCWSLWKEGRGTNEAHQRGGKLQAVEYVEAGQPAEGDEKRTRVELETSSFDGFSVIWTPGVHGAVECNIAVRFNFLSTDFSHSKGVKGIPVRLCTKTTRYPLPDQASSSASPKDASSSAPEICFCKVKLFRDHGAERKLSNDVAHVKKSMDKLKQQIAQAESGLKDFSKRKRSGGAAIAQAKAAPDLQRMGKAPKHKRTWSMSSTSSNGNGNNGNANGSGPDDSSINSSSGTPTRAAAANGVRMAVEEDLHCKLQNLQDMFTSTRPVSILYLRGDELDDPDLHPVSLPGEGSSSGGLAKVESRDNLMAWRDQSGRSSVVGSSMVSPSPSSLSLHSQVSVSGGNGNGASGNTGASGWSDYHGDHLEIKQGSRQGSNQPTRVGKTDDSGNLSGWIEALDVDSSYRPQPSDRPKPAACFYVLRRNGPNNQTGSNGGDSAGTGAPRELHRAVYLAKRTLHDFVGQVAAKWSLDPSKAVRTVRVLPQGLEVELDDEAVAELPEGQDMVLDVVEPSLSAQQQHSSQQAVKKEWEMAVDGDGEATYELRLSF